MADLKEIIQALESIESQLQSYQELEAGIDLHLLIVSLLDEVKKSEDAQYLLKDDREQVECQVWCHSFPNTCRCINPLDFSMTWYMWMLVGLIAWCFMNFMYFFFIDKNR